MSAADPNVAEQQRRYREFLDLMPLTINLAGLPTSDGRRKVLHRRADRDTTVRTPPRVQTGATVRPRADYALNSEIHASFANRGASRTMTLLRMHLTGERTFPAEFDRRGTFENLR